ncbi:MAG: hypothetical protein D4R67_09590 [Bacteroidetes bacterium]|nr:MAG: hypothetical protein D4R67_09590 [Bacteroidota bacterium]
MKEKEGFVDCPEQQMIVYVEKEDGQYGPMQTGSYITKNYIEDYFLKRNNLISKLKEQVDREEISPVKLFMVLEDLTVSELSARTRIPFRKVKKHLLPGPFKTIPNTLLEHYAAVFNITVEQLLDVDAGYEQKNDEDASK